MSSPDARDERELALRTDAARTRIPTGVWVHAAEQAALERIVLQVPPAGRPAPYQRRGSPALHPGENDNPIWPHCDGLIWPHLGSCGDGC